MPAAIAVAAIQAGIGYAAGVTIGTLSVAATAAVSFVSTLALGLVSSALAPKPKAASNDFSRQLQDNVLTVRQAAAPRKIVFGRTRVGGVYTFMHTTGSGNSTLHTVATVAGHAVRGFDALFLDDEIVPLDSNGDATGKYAGKVSCKFGLGTTAGDSGFHSALTAAVGSDMWGANHLQDGCAKAYVKFVYDEDLFGGGLPNPSFVVSGYANVEDTRFATSPVTTAWTDNAALCIAQYLRDAARGMGYASADIDETALIAAANDCDEMVARVAVDVTFTADATSDILTVADTSAHLRTGTRFTVSSANSPATLPGGLSEATNYFWIPLTPTTGRIATSLVNSRSGTYVDVTSAGTGEHTLSVNAEPRYTLNGWLSTDEDPGEVLPRLLAAMSGNKIESSGSVVLQAGVWRSAANAIEEDEVDGRISSRHRRSRRDLFNGIKGVFTNPDDKWQPTDFPVVAPSAYLTEDSNERIWKDAELRFTDSPSMAQRICRIDLEKNRRQQAATIPLTMAGMKHRAGDTVTVNNTKRGWPDKTFLLSRWMLDPRDIDGDNPRLGTSVVVDEIDANVYAWTPETDESAMAPSPLTTLPDAFNSSPPTDLSLSSGTAVLGIRLDGTIFSRIKATWTAPSDAQVTSGGVIEVQYKKSSVAVWQPSAFVDGAATETFILDVDDGIAYDVRIRSRRGSLADPSVWVTQSNYTVLGKQEPPSDVATLSVQQSGVNVNFTWTAITDPDLDIYEIRYMTAPFVWSDARRCATCPSGDLTATANVPPSPTDADGIQVPWVFGIKAKDTSKGYSTNAATKSLTVVNPQEVVVDDEQWPLWSGDSLWVYETGYTQKTQTASFSNASTTSIVFGADGGKLYVFVGTFATGTPISAVYQFNLDVPWRIPDVPLTAANSDKSFSLTAEMDDLTCGAFSADGTKMYVNAYAKKSGGTIDGGGNGNLAQYSLSTAWEVDTASLDGTIPHSEQPSFAPGCMVSFKPDGSKLYYYQYSHSTTASEIGNVLQYDLPTPWDVTGATDDSISVNLADMVSEVLVTTGDVDLAGFYIKPDGTKILISSIGLQSIIEFEFGTAWDLSTVTFNAFGAPITLNDGVSTPASYFISESVINWYSLTASDDGKIYLSSGRKGAALSTGAVWQISAGMQFVRNPLTGNLNPIDRMDASANTFDVFDNYVQDPVPTTIYNSAEVDLGKDVTSRVWADVQAYIGPGASGNAEAEYQVDYRKSVEDFDGFQEWTVGEIYARYLANRIIIDQTSGASGLARFRPVVDAEERTERDNSVAVTSGGTAVVFETPFVNPPFLRVWNVGNDGNTAGFTSLSATGFTAFSYDGTSPDSGTIAWEATGV